MRSTAISALLALAFFASQNLATAQNFPGSGGGGFGSFGQGGGGSSSTGLVTRDTTEIHYFFAENPSENIPHSDSLLGSFQQYDPLRQQAFDHAGLGYLGSAHRPLFWQPAANRRGFDVGLHPFDLYQIRTPDVRYYRLVQATTQAGHSQGPTQQDGYTFVRFSRNFADGLNLSLESRRIKNLGAFDNQQTANVGAALGLWYHNKFGNYDGFFSFVSNSVEQQDNGGVPAGETDELTDAFQLDVNLQTANTRHANRAFAYTQYFYLNQIFSEASQLRREQRAESRDQRRALERQQTGANLDSTAIQLSQDTSGQPPVSSGQPPVSSGQPPVSSGQYPASSIQPPLPPPQRTYTIYHQIAWQKETYKFSALPADSLGFGQFWVDDRGLRHFVQTRKLENTVKLQTFKLRQTDALSATAKQRDLLEVGLVHSLHFIEQEPRDTGALHNLFLTGNLQFSPSDRLRAIAFAHLGLVANAGDFRLGGELFFDLKKLGNLRLEAVNQLYSPTLLQHRFFATEQLIWKNDFSKTLETSLMGTYSLPSFHASVGGQLHFVKDFIYFDSLGLPRQKGGTTSVFQLVFRKDFHLGPLHSENWLGLQAVTSDVLRLPPCYAKHSLYLEGKIFKKVMLSRIGADARLAGAYSPPGYQPLTGQFFLQQGQPLPFTPLVDVFLSFKVKTFRFFFKVENALSFFTKEYYFQTAGHPLPFGFTNGGLRVGVHWRLVD